jgi:putative DNA primase/helicase
MHSSIPDFASAGNRNCDGGTPAATALAYAQDRGWPVFPTKLVPRRDGTLDKVPCIKWGKGAARDPGTIREWWQRWPDAVISIPTGARTGIVILDIDCKKGRNGFDTLADLGKAILPDTPMSHTPSGGVHVYFARTDIEIRNSAGTKGLGVGLDVRGDGGQVVLPSPNSGYWWDPHYNFDTVALWPAPAWLGHRPPKERPAVAAGARGPGRRFDPQAILAEACRRIEHAADGTKHDTYRQETFRVATMVRDQLISEADARHALEPVIMALGKRADGHYGRVEKYYNDAFDEGLAAPPLRTARRARR